MELYLRPNYDSPDDDVDIDRPQLIPLQLPVALVSNLSSDSHLDISLPKSYCNDGGESEGRSSSRSTMEAIDKNDCITLTITQHQRSGKKQSSSSDIYSMNIIDHHKRETIDWYHELDQNVSGKSGSSLSSNNNELQYIGTTSKKHYRYSSLTSNDAAANNKLKEIGERTRKLLEEERKKRKEIVRLDENEQSLLALPKKLAPPPESSTATTSLHLATEKKMMNVRKRKRQRIVASNIDGWMPNVDDLLILPNLTTAPSTYGNMDPQQLQQSSIVRLHGLPMGVKPEHIRKFFHGLNPGIIFILPTFSHPIQGWDANATPQTGKNIGYEDNPQCIVKRHSSTVRVFVKFTSSLVANAAIERTGESIGFDVEGKDDKSGALYNNGKAARVEKIVGAAISISPVSKYDASFLQKHMAIDTRKGEAISITVKRIEEQLGVVVTKLIWEMAIQKLKLSHRILGKLETAINCNHTVPTNEAQYRSLAKLYNRVIDMHEMLELESGIIFTHAFDPTIHHDSAHKITQSVSNWLLDTISTLGRLLNESRHWLKLGKNEQLVVHQS